MSLRVVGSSSEDAPLAAAVDRAAAHPSRDQVLELALTELVELRRDVRALAHELDRLSVICEAQYLALDQLGRRFGRKLGVSLPPLPPRIARD